MKSAVVLLIFVVVGESLVRADVASNFRTKPKLARLSPTIRKGISNYQRNNGVSSRIINGTQSKLGQFPYYVMLSIDDLYMCGGSLIKPNWVLTVSSFTQIFMA
jgi:hypothetical protein